MVLKSSVLCFSPGANIKNEVLQCTSAREQHAFVLCFTQCRGKNEPSAGRCSLRRGHMQGRKIAFFVQILNWSGEGT